MDIEYHIGKVLSSAKPLSSNHNIALALQRLIKASKNPGSYRWDALTEWDKEWLKKESQ